MGRCSSSTGSWNYFALAIADANIATWSFVDGELHSTANAYENSCIAKNGTPGAELSCWLAPKLTGPWSGVRVIGATRW